jgi:hypothetical protein
MTTAQRETNRRDETAARDDNRTKRELSREEGIEIG